MRRWPRVSRRIGRAVGRLDVIEEPLLLAHALARARGRNRSDRRLSDALAHDLMCHADLRCSRPRSIR